MQQHGLHVLYEIMPVLWLVPKILFQKSHGQKISIIACQSVRRTLENYVLISDITFFMTYKRSRATITQYKKMPNISSHVETIPIPDNTVIKIKMVHLRQNHPSGKALFWQLLVGIDGCNQKQYHYSETSLDICTFKNQKILRGSKDMMLQR